MGILRLIFLPLKLLGNLITLIVTVAVLAIGGIALNAWYERDFDECTVQEKEHNEDDGDMYLHTDCGTFQTNNNWLKQHFNGDEFFDQIGEEGVYDFTVTGWHIPFLDRPPTVIEFEALGDEE